MCAYELLTSRSGSYRESDPLPLPGEAVVDGAFERFAIVGVGDGGQGFGALAEILADRTSIQRGPHRTGNKQAVNMKRLGQFRRGDGDQALERYRYTFHIMQSRRLFRQCVDQQCRGL